MLVVRRDGPHPHVGRRADVEHGAAVDELAHQHRILDGADAVPDPVGVQRFERAPDGRRADHLAGVRDGAQPALTGEPEGIGELLGRRLALDAAEPDPDHAAIAAGDRPAHDVGRLLGR